MLPRLAAELFDVFSAGVVAATGRLSVLCTCVEEYVAKLEFLAEMVSKVSLLPLRAWCSLVPQICMVLWIP